MAKIKTIIATLLMTAIFLAVSPITPVMASPITITISPTSSTVGSTVTVSGIGATPGGEVRVYWHDMFLATTTANGAGGYSVDIIVPSERAGPVGMWVRDVATGESAEDTFMVEPKIVLIPDRGSPWWGGDEIIVRGTGFGVYEVPYDPWRFGANVTLELNGHVWPNITSTSEDGSFEARFNVPWVPKGVYTVTATDALGNSTFASFTVVPKIISHTTSGSTATQVYVEGSGFAANEPVTVTFDGINVTFREGLTADPQGGFGIGFSVPEVPDGIYTINATDALGNSASAPFVVPGPVISLTPNTTVGSSVVTVTGLGFRPGWPVAITINETASMDTLYMGMMLMQTFPDEYGSFEFSFILPLAKPGIYNVTANKIIEWEQFIKLEAVTWASLTVVDLVMAKLTEIQGDIAIIQTEVGEIEVKLHDINATILLIQDDVAVIQTSIGTVIADLTLINATLISVEGNIVTIQTTLGTIKTTLEGWTGSSTSPITTPTGTFKVLVLTTSPTLEETVAFSDNTVTITVSGPSGTAGKTNVVVPKGLLTGIESSIDDIEVTIDDEQVSFTYTEQAECYVLSVSYTHSVHEIEVFLTGIPPPPFPWVLIIAIIVVVAAIAGVAVYILEIRKPRIVGAKAQ